MLGEYSSCSLCANGFSICLASESDPRKTRTRKPRWTLKTLSKTIASIGFEVALSLLIVCEMSNEEDERVAPGLK